MSVKEHNPKPADNELTSKSQLLSSNRVIASAMLSIPVQACEEKEKGITYKERIVHMIFMKHPQLQTHKKIYSTANERDTMKQQTFKTICYKP